MKEFIVTGSQHGVTNAKVRVFARDKHDAAQRAIREYGFTSYSKVEQV